MFEQMGQYVEHVENEKRRKALDYSHLSPAEIKEKFYEEYPEERPEIKMALRDLANNVPIDPHADYSHLSPTEIKAKFYEEYPQYLPKNLYQHDRENHQQSTLGAIGSHLLHKDLIPLGIGAVDGVYDIIPSITNLALKPVNYFAGTNIKLPYDIATKLGNQSPEARFMQGLGSLAGSLATTGGMYFGAKSIPQIKRLGDVAIGAASGYLTGGSSGPYSDEGRIANAITAGAIPLAGNALAPAIAKRIVGKKKALKAAFETGYNDLFKNIDDSGLGNKSVYGIPKGARITLSKRAEQQIRGAGGKDLAERVSSFHDAPTFKNAHELQSNIMKKMQGLEDRIAKQTMRDRVNNVSLHDSALRDKYAKLSTLRDSIKQSMKSFLDREGRQDLLDNYVELGDSYKRNMLPYFHPAIAKYEAGRLSASGLARKLMENPDLFEPDQLGATIKGLKSRSVIKSASPLLKLAGLGGLAGGVGYTLGSIGAPGAGPVSKLAEKVL